MTGTSASVGMQLSSLGLRRSTPEASEWSFVPCNRMCLRAFGLRANTFAVGRDGFADSLASLCVSAGRQGGGQEDKRR